MSSIIVAHALTYQLPTGRELFTNLNFTLDEGVTGLVGPNGVGKSILAQVLAGELPPTSGVVRRRTPVRLFRQRELPPELTVQEHLADSPVWLGSGARLLRGIDKTAMCSALSGGQWMRVRLAASLVDGYLILDEPTNDLDQHGRDVVREVVRTHRGGVLLISHDRDLLATCDRILEFSNRGIAQYGNGWDAFVIEHAQERERLERTLERGKRDRDRLLRQQTQQHERQERRNRRGSARAARGGLPNILTGARKRNAQQTTGRRKAIATAHVESATREVYSALSELKVDPVMYATLSGCELPAQKLVAQARDFNIRLDDWLYAQDLNFTWRGNARVALRGDNGSGKSTLLRMLTGAQLETRGLWRSGEVRTLLVDQALSQLSLGNSVLENVAAGTDASESELRTGLSHFLFRGDAVFQRVNELSGGERLRAALAQGFLGEQRPELLILDEPTNNLDLANIEFLEALVSQFRGAVVVVSHDEHFLEACRLQEEFIVRRRQR